MVSVQVKYSCPHCKTVITRAEAWIDPSLFSEPSKAGKKSIFYCPTGENREGKTLAGIFLDREDAIKQIQASGPHDIWEYYYSWVVVETYYLNMVGSPAIASAAQKQDWFYWEWNEAEQTGKYSPCEQPEWAVGIFGWR